MQRLYWLERLAPLAAALLLAACATRPETQARLGLRLAPATLGETISVQQQLTVERSGSTNDLVAALEVDPQRVSLVGLALGMRVLSLEFDGAELTEWRHPMLPSQVRAADVLEDLQLTLWPVEEIARALPSGWDIADQGLKRTLRRDGEVVATITYSGMPRWQGTAVLDNLRYRYRLTVVSASE
ncbi:DUF3261 domain-containing protein [Massilia sp. CFBP9012]|uniref:DUF3261 domain-containing protein n=1 Tax=Massilia sp. CFBP9012 TaxID=3096531 RepID=UPI002A69D031|nr:DUF3261 domain-containing protein [Massilia sp. CFBP9012]MDY0973658.1 DUF3261 domain-containing protein [Massilia sp. CFBP9012]